MELICRTCLKANTTYFNIFEHLQSNKFISDLIMDCVPIKIVKDDGFPASICNVCLDKLSSAYEFREMAIQSNVALQKCYNSKVERSAENSNANYVFLKLEDPSIKNEQVDPMLDLISCPHHADVQDVIIENENTMPNSPENHLDLLHNVDDLLPLEDDHMSYDTIKEENGESAKRNDNKKINLDDTSYEDKTEMPNRKRKRKERNKYNNESQLELLDNTEYLKIKQMGLSKKEKDRATILCKECNRTFNYRYYIAVHIHVHTGNLPYKCDLCELRFPKESRLNQHRRVHFQTKEVACEECGMAFFSIHHLKSHKAKHSEDRPHKCGVCDKTFKFSAVLKKHELIHKKDKSFMCEICGKIFTEFAGLSHHQVTHSTSEKIFACKTCGKSFARKKALNLHIKRHSNEKPFVCSYCGKSFRYNAVLQTHVLIHTDSKPFACEICGKKFRQRSCIPRHMRIHTGETPYPCELCPTSFKYSHHLLNHMKMHEQIASN